MHSLEATLKEYLNIGNDWVKQCGIFWGNFTGDAMVLHAEVKEANLNGIGFLHGGVLYTLADTTAGFYAHLTGESFVTLDSHVNFLRSATKGIITCTATAIHRGRRIHVYKTVIVDEEGTVLMDGTFNMMKVGMPIPEDQSIKVKR